MSTFRFIHAADLHLGSPFAGLARADAESAERFALATREAFSELVRRTIELEAAFLVIAGDVYDGEWKDNSIGLFFARELARLDRAGIRVVLLKGNHDADSVVTRTISLPESVLQFASRKPSTLRLDGLDVALHGQSFAERAAPDNLARAYPAPVAGCFNIGVLHTSCAGYAAHEPYAPCSLDDLMLKGYDYWALGHVHEHEVLARDPWIVFPGCLQGRNVRECGPKGAALVEVEDGRVRAVERLLVDRARWASVEVDLSGVGDEPEALRLVERAVEPVAAAAEGRTVALRLTLSGATPLHGRFAADPRRLAAEAQAAAHRVEADLWLEELKLRTGPPARASEAAPELKSLDLSALMAGLDDDAEIRARVADAVAAVANRLPSGIDAAGLAEELDGLIAEARALALGRLGA
ncbi:metallophosphoesterase family protein [Hansschlegelia zhihuaiae]|uniref:DNA repair exonuclease n=1 Tax=Hansschlegelia zhihuaiae TaxID=405005 RepID=A0A4Q0MMJ9_9HYPH|nr:DNA repair exonuclease [Hansschlegelia zhihuaiae]RXF74309.1 DNA repair exonuclease [Hansschlegelia zhihuaiae]